MPKKRIRFSRQSYRHFQAAALLHVTLTAWQALIEIANLAPGQEVLVHAAAGGVGHVAVQLSKIRGATTIGTASVNLETLNELEVDEKIDYSTTAFENVVLDLIGGDTQMRSWAVMRPGGILLATVQPPSEATALVDSGQIKPMVSTILPLMEIRMAHEMIEDRHISKDRKISQ